MYMDWGHAEFAGYIGGDLRAVAGDGNKFNEVGTAIVNTLREEKTSIYGRLGIQRVDGDPLTEFDIAFVEALIAEPDTVAALQLPPGDINLTATTMDWRTLTIESLAEDASPDATDGVSDGMQYVANGRVAVDNEGERTHVALVEREDIDYGHFREYLNQRYGRVGYSAARERVQKAALAYRSSAHWSLATWLRILVVSDLEKTLALMLEAAGQGTAEDYLFAALG